MARDIQKIFEVNNVVTLLEDTELATIGQDAVQGYQADDESRAEWNSRNKEGMKLAMQLAEGKNFPFDGAANVMYPLLSIASKTLLSNSPLCSSLKRGSFC